MSEGRGKTRTEVLAESKKRGLLATSAAVATGVATATLGVVPLTVVGAGATGVLTYRWIRHRMKNGIKF